MTTTQELQQTIEQLVIPGKGILAADESNGTIGKRFEKIHLDNTEENRRAYRSLLASTPKLGEHISGVILYEETLGQKTDRGAAMPEAFASQGIVPGIKVDQGLVSFASSPSEKITQGLVGLPERLRAFKEHGARFAKWRAVYEIAHHTPSAILIRSNAELLARYASICQSIGIVPIVEPELLMDDDHDLATAAQVSEKILVCVFNTLRKHHVSLEHIILKPNMVVPAKKCADQSNPHDIARATITTLRRTVPAAVPSIKFLSGGQSPEQATINLSAINSLGTQPWLLSFSYGRALQETCISTWKGNPENLNAAQAELFKRAKLNGAAAMGRYQSAME